MKKIIAVFGGHLYEEKEYSFLKSLSERGSEAGYIVLAFTFSTESLLDNKIAGADLLLRELCPGLQLDAIVLLYESMNSNILLDSLKELGAKKNIPVFFVGGEREGCINLTLNYREGFKSIVNHMIKHHGCRRINMVAGIEGNSYSDERIDAYREALEENGITFEKERIGYGDFWDRPTRDVVHRFLSADELPEAIVCANDAMAITACSVIKESGLRVPEDIMVTGFDNIMSGLLNIPSISTVGPDFDQEASLIMDELTGGKPGKYGDLSIASLLRFGDSCGCGDSGDAEAMVSVVSESFFDINWHVQFMNELLADAAMQSSLHELSGSIGKKIDVWKSFFFFAGLFSELIEENGDSSGKKKFTEFFRCENAKTSSIGESYDSDKFFPGFDRLTADESKFCLVMLRALSAGEHLYGYTATAFKEFGNRDLRRFDEFGRFISTAIHMVIANRTLGVLNSNLIQANKEIEKKSVMDYLTGIYNRRGFFAELDRILSLEKNKGRVLTVFSIDMDGLKYINDNFGHKDGDFAIRTMAQAIGHFASRNGFAARYGGDEFACALITDKELDLTADRVRSRLDTTLNEQEAVKSKEYPITASIGSCSQVISDDMDIEAMIKVADERMYADKLLRKKNRT